MALAIKICGLTSVEDARAAMEAGADYLGFVLYAKSPRGIDAGRLAEIASSLGGQAKLVGVFVNTPRVEVERIAGDCGLHAVQLHGDESAADFRGMGTTVWRATKWDGTAWTPAPEEWNAERLVVDAPAGGRYGGSGEKADWKQAALLAKRHAIMLAGGLTAENVAAAIHAVRPAGVDTASGVEAAPGKKDLGKIVRFIEAARAADERT